MKKKCLALLVFGLLSQFSATSAFAQQRNDLRIDPLLLISLKECRHITQTLGSKLFPGWEFQKTPILFYRPNVQDILINFPHQPKGFSPYTGFNPLGDDSIYVRNDTTLFPVDGQNTSAEIDGIPVLVVADQFSRMRNDLIGVLNDRSKDWINLWLKDWGFIESPYFEIQVILHEAFHVYQSKMAPDKGANERTVAQYPVLDPINNALYILEGIILKDALFPKDPNDQLQKIKEFVAVRSFRQSRLSNALVEYENLVEYSEGLAKYTEYKLMKSAEEIEPIKEMYYHNGFNGYRDVLKTKFHNAIDNMVKIVGVTDDRFGNKFGAGPLRFKLYELGACQALLLDEVLPSWKEQIFANRVYLSDLLKQAVALSSRELKLLLQKVKSEYHYEEAYRNKLEFETEGKKKIAEKVAAIMEAGKTLVRITFGSITDQARVARFTPFGVTQVNKDSEIYEMVPLLIFFKKGVTLDFKQAIPVLVNQANHEIIFSISTPPQKLIVNAENKLELDEFILSAAFDISSDGNKVQIQLK